MYKSATQGLPDRSPVTALQLREMKAAGEKIVTLTAYDASFAALLEASGIEMILVGDSLGMVVQGHGTTVPVDIEDVIYHTRCAANGCHSALLVADMPFMSYATPQQALDNGARLMQEGGAQMVKLEGGAIQVETIRFLTERGIPVCAHLGLLPQSVHKLGGYRVQGRDEHVARQLREDAVAVADAGAELLVIECVPSRLAAEIAASIDIPVIGIGAGADVDGQILVIYDLLGITPGKRPKFTKDFLKGTGSAAEAVKAYVTAVKEGQFPAAENSYE